MPRNDTSAQPCSSGHQASRQVLVVTDLDGTLWDQHQCIHADTLSAVEELEARGIPVLVATGRRPASTRSGFALNNFWKPAVMLNGTLGVTFPSEHRFHQATFTASEAQLVLEAFADCGHVPCVYGLDGHTYLADNATTGPRHRKGMVGGVRDVQTTNPDHIVQAGEALGFSIIGVELRGLESLAPRLREFGMIVDHYQDPLYGGWSVMAQPPGVSKQTGIEAFIAHAGLDNPLVIAVGDGGNDTEMVAAADIGLAIVDGDPSVLAVADQHIGPPTQGGWAEILNVVNEL